MNSERLLNIESKGCNTVKNLLKKAETDIIHIDKPTRYMLTPSWIGEEPIIFTPPFAYQMSNNTPNMTYGSPIKKNFFIINELRDSAETFCNKYPRDEPISK